MSLITRWKCPLCGQTFTVYPEFALPYKRYLRDTILEKSTQYIEDDLPEKGKRVSYRRLVKENKMALGYASTETGNIDERQLAPSTAHRWLSTLSCLSNTIRKGQELIKQKSSTSTIFRKILPVTSVKYRSTKRKKALQDCRKLLHVNEEYQKIFGPSIFPHLATVCQWK